jgi:hypothetical protein
MLRGIRQSENARALFAALALLVLAMQAVIPSGFMPMQTARGVVITLCTGQGAMNVVVDRDHAPGRHQDQDIPGDDKGQGNMHCAYAGGASMPALALPALDATLPAWIVVTGPIAFALKTGWIARLAAPPPPSSGPPAAA